MIKHHAKFLRYSLLLSDILITVISFPIAIGLQNKFSIALKSGIINYLIFKIDWNIIHYSSMLFWLIPIWILALISCQSYESFRSKYTIETLLTIIHAAVIATILSAIVFYLHNFEIKSSILINLHFSIVLIYPSICIVLLFLSRICLIYFFRIVRRLGYNQRRMIIVGTGPRAYKNYQKIIIHPQWGFHIIGFVALEKNDTLPKNLSHHSILGTIDEIDDILHKYPVDDVFFVVPRKWLNQMEPVVVTCDIIGITVHFAIDLFSMKVSKTTVSSFHGLPVLSLNATSTNYAALVFKRLTDIIISFLGIVLLLPFYFIIMIAIKLDSKGPLFFTQKRLGLNGRVFKMLKFRTMVENAEELKDNLLSKNEQVGPVFKIKDDPRTTKIGKFLRKLSIDELPQLINVFLGDMSLVGPRPPLPSEAKNYQSWQRRRLSMRPGITCIWQVSGRSNLNFDKWMELDLEYIDNWSTFLDFKILLKTIPCVLSTKGSH